VLPSEPGPLKSFPLIISNLSFVIEKQVAIREVRWRQWSMKNGKWKMENGKCSGRYFATSCWLRYDPAELNPHVRHRQISLSRA
jgi:hypothetical protein